MGKSAAKKATVAAVKHTRLVVQVRPEHVEALLEEAERRRKPGQVRADVSAVLRDVLDTWLAKPRR